MMQTRFRRQLILGIALAVFLVVLLGVFSYLTARREREAESWINHTMLVKAKLREIDLGIKENAAYIRARRRYRDLDSLLKGGDKSAVLYTWRELRDLVHDNRAQASRAAALYQHILGLFQLWEKINPEETRADLVKEETYFREELRRMDRLGALIADMDGAEDGLLQERRARTARLRDTNNFFNIGGSVLILLIVVSLAFIISAEFRKRRKAEGLLQEEMEAREQLHEETVLRNEVLSGAQQVLQAGQKASEVAAFMDTVLLGLLRFTGLTSGIAYVSGEKNLLQPVSHQGVITARVQSLSAMELLSAMPEQGRSVVVNDQVPAGFWQLEAASGSSLPGTLVHIYLKVQDRLLGLIELASFGSLTTKQRVFLEMIPDGIAIRLAAVQLAEGRALLLGQLQEKQEILLNQQEELRQTNEELLSQTNVLQASEEELRVQEEELKQINAELEEKNEALEAARQVMTSRASELELSGKYKSEFLANMSHELRTPLNSILILANLLRDNKQGNLSDKQVEYARIIGNSGSDLLQLINDILDLSKIEAGKVELHIETMPLEIVARHMRELFQAQAEQKQVRLEIVSESIDITTDIQRLEQVLKNLLSNAVKFTPEGGSVTLHISAGPAQAIRFRVTDTGIGIDPSKLELIFDAFRQEDGGTNRKYGGTGLGLSISRELARILKGTISVESRQGEGSTFTLLLPEHIGTADMPVTAPLAIPGHAAPAMADPTVKTILIIEDDPNFALILRDFAEERQYKTLHAGNGKEGLALARAHRPDAIILDMQMPVMDGGAVLKQLKADPELSRIPVHVISAMDMNAPMGAVAYVRKPVTQNGLEEVFARIADSTRTGDKRLLIWSAAPDGEETLGRLTGSLPSAFVCDHVSDREGLEAAGAQFAYDCLLVDIRSPHEAYLEQLAAIRSEPAFAGVPVVLLIDQEISPAGELRLRSLSEAIVMESGEAHSRLKDELELFMHRVKTQETSAAGTPVSFTDDNVLAGKKVLVADDDMRNVFALVGLLEQQQMSVVTASNGLEAVAALEEGEPVDIVLMDIMMPEMDGYEAMRRLRARPAFRQLPIIAITAKAMAEDRELCIRSGASDYISKPVDNQKLLSLLRVWLS